MCRKPRAGNQCLHWNGKGKIECCVVRSRTNSRRPFSAMMHSMNRRCHNRDYRAPAFYMVTMTTHGRRPWFGVCADNRCTLNRDGWLVHDLWRAITRDYPQIEVSTLCIMPDHLHGILRASEWMEKPVGVAIRAFKSQVTSALRKKYNNPELVLCAHLICAWQGACSFFRPRRRWRKTHRHRRSHARFACK